jgi:hypothetical protein
MASASAAKEQQLRKITKQLGSIPTLSMNNKEGFALLILLILTFSILPGDVLVEIP